MQVYEAQCTKTLRLKPVTFTSNNAFCFRLSVYLPSSIDQIRPPILSVASRTTISLKPSRHSMSAAAIPEIPAPITMTLGFFFPFTQPLHSDAPAIFLPQPKCQRKKNDTHFSHTILRICSANCVTGTRLAKHAKETERSVYVTELP